MNPHIQFLNRRLSVHKRRMKYWSNLPGFYGPSPKSMLLSSRMYELACADAKSIADMIERETGRRCLVLDIKRTFQARFSNHKAKEIFL